MSQIDSRPADEQRHWWLTQAQTALHKYDLASAQVEWLAYTHNAVFEITHTDAKYSLRLSAKIDDTRQRWQSEAALLNHLHTQSDLIAPQPVAGGDSAFYQAWAADPFAVQSLLFRFVAGKNRTSETITVEDVHKIGEFLGHFHNSTSQFQPDNHFTRPSLDADGLFTNEGLYPLVEVSAQLFSPEQDRIMTAVADQVRASMPQLGIEKSEFGLIHGDFLLHNILFHEGSVRALDFEYCGYGYYLYDLTPLLWQLKPHNDYAAFEQAIWTGYTNIRPLTDQHRELLETFIAGRQVASLRWVAANQHNPYYVGKVSKIIAQRVQELQGFLDTGTLTRQ